MSVSGLLRGALAGLVAGLVAVAAMELLATLTGVRPLSELLQQPILSLLPGQVFGILIDTLQHAGKVLEEAGLLLGMVAVLAVVGAAAGAVAERSAIPWPGLLAGAGAWLVLMLAILPLLGMGPFGLAEGPATPVVWGVVLGIYGLAWEATWWRPPEAAADAGRRRVLGLLPAGLAVAGLAVLAATKGPGWVRSILVPPEATAGPVPAITPADRFYTVSKNFQDPIVPAGSWTVRVTGLVGRTLRLGRRDLESLPATVQAVTLECVSNTVGGDLMSTALFTGVPLRDLVTMAEPRPEARALNFTARDGYTESLRLDLVMGSPEIVVAYLLNGAPLTTTHGFPARVLIPGRYGMKGPKWLDEIELAAGEEGGFWEAQGWDAQAIVKTTARLDSPEDGSLVHVGEVPLAGVAFAGARGIQAVEWSADGGRSWAQAELEPPLSPLTWTLWRATWRPGRRGAYTLVVRARDGGGELQTAQAAPSFPSGATGHHRIRVDVAS